MLVLTRKSGESIVLPETGVKITVLCVNGNRVRLGIEAPATIRISRQELLPRRADNNELSTVPVQNGNRQ